MEQVNVLISTYNGEKYIEEQIESIVSQTYPYIKIYIRDDGSTDATCSTIYRLAEKYKDKIIFSPEENIGYRKSFVKLLKDAAEGSYWAFCDQDDVWLPDKILWAVEWLKQQDDTIPLLFHGSYDLVSEDLLTKNGSYTPPAYEINFRRALTDSVYQGFSIVMNQKLRKYILRCDGDSNFSHDWMAGLIVQKFGRACFDERIACKHRRLDTSISGMTFRNRVSWFVKTLSGESDIKSTAKEFVKTFGQGVEDSDYKIARWFIHDKYCFKDMLKKVFYPRRWRQSISSEIALRILMLLGKI